MADELHVVTVDEFEERSRELAHEVLQTGEPLFIMDGDSMVARLLPPELSLEEIRRGLRVMDEIDEFAEETRGTWATDDQRRD